MSCRLRRIVGAACVLLVLILTGHATIHPLLQAADPVQNQRPCSACASMHGAGLTVAPAPVQHAEWRRLEIGLGQSVWIPKTDLHAALANRPPPAA